MVIAGLITVLAVRMSCGLKSFEDFMDYQDYMSLSLMVRLCKWSLLGLISYNFGGSVTDDVWDPWPTCRLLTRGAGALHRMHLAGFGEDLKLISKK